MLGKSTVIIDYTPLTLELGLATHTSRAHMQMKIKLNLGFIHESE